MTNNLSCLLVYKKLTALCLLVFFINVAKASCVYDQLIQGENLQIGTMLTWATTFEENNAMFIVEKSEDGISFTNIGSVEGSGNSNDIRKYNFLDVMASSDRIFYRLKQVDFDGSFSYSDITVVQQQYKNDFMVVKMTNVATQGLFDMTIDAFKSGEMTYNLADYKQNVIFEDKMLVINGLNDLSFDLADQKEGIYKINLSMEGEVETIVVEKITNEIKNKANVATKDKLDNSKN